MKTSLVFTTGDNHRVIGLSPIARALNSVKLAALPAFHAFSGGLISSCVFLLKGIFYAGKRSWTQKIP